MFDIAVLKRVHSCFADANPMDVWLIRVLTIPFTPAPGVTLIVDDWVATPCDVAYRTMHCPENIDDNEIREEVAKRQKDATERGLHMDATRVAAWLKGPSVQSWFEIYVEPNQEIFDAQANRQRHRQLDEVVAEECENGWEILSIGPVPEGIDKWILSQRHV